jgi:glycosyltransferase involved in cell wall biosynthesis
MHPSAGGPPVVVERLSLLAPLHGLSSSIITTSLYCEDQGQELQKTLSRKFNVTVLPISGPRILKHARGAAEVIDSAVKNADCVHLHTLWHPLNVITRRACHRHGRKYALMPHGMLDPYSLRQKRWRKVAYLAAIERRNLQCASRVIFTTPLEQQAALQGNTWLTPGEVVPLGADFPNSGSHESLAAAFIRLFPQVTDRRCLLFLGRIHQKKGIELIIGALGKLIVRYPELLFIVAGTGERSYVDSINQLIHQKGLENHVLFTGMLVDEIKWGAFACAEVFVLPSKQENFAISMAEAMHMALPVIVSEKVNSWPFVKMANCGFVVEEKEIEDSLLERLHELLSNSCAAHQLGIQGQRFARENFTWERVAQDMGSIYRQMLFE